MTNLNFHIKSFFFLVALCGAISFSALAQEERKPEDAGKTVENQDDDVLQINTDLIQTGVAVFDKKGEFVTNLKQEDFELLVDGKPVAIQFFEPNTVKNNRAEIKNEKGDVKSSTASTKSAVQPLGGRTILFVVDDLHLSADSHNRVRKLILKFIEREMLPEDVIAVVSTTGKIGFLQQFTGDKMVLQAAVERLIYDKDRRATDRSNPPMTEYEAQLIDRYDPQVTGIFANLIIRESPGTTFESAQQIARSRARSVLAQAAIISRGTYSTLEQAVRNSAQMPNRKIVFFISDGFVLDATNSDSSYQMRRITDAAARTNTVIYSFDAKGLEAGFPEGASASARDGGFRVQAGERFEMQDGLNALADETGGRFIKNTNDLQTGLTRSIEEASQYYLLAWEPSTENGKSERLRKIEVKVRNRPELKIRVQGGYLDETSKPETSDSGKTKNKPDEKKPPLSPAERQLNRAVTAQIPARQLPTSLVVNYIDVLNEGALLAAAMQVNSDAVEFTAQGDKAVAEIDIVGFVYNADGKREGYFRLLQSADIAASKLTETERPNFYYNYQLKLKPGLYQMRVAARDVKSGRVGSAVQWIKIPDLSKRKLELSSLILSEQTDEKKKVLSENKIANAVLPEVSVSVDRQFARSSRLRYLVFIYNAAPGANRPDVTLQTQIFRGKEAIVTSPANPISAEGQDLQRLPYIAEISLNPLLPGRYELQITVQDRIAKTTAVRRVNFEIK